MSLEVINVLGEIFVFNGLDHIRNIPIRHDMARVGRLAFLAIAVVFHIIYSMSIFDVYFVSPIVSGMDAFKVDLVKAPAKRLVLYVGMWANG